MQKALTLIAGAILGLTCLAVRPLTHLTAAGAKPEESTHRYGRTLAMRGPQWEYGVYHGSAGRFSWHDARDDLQAVGIRAFLDRMGVELRELESTDDLETVLLNHLGRHGWELVFVQTPPDGWTFWFKRPLEPDSG